METNQEEFDKMENVLQQDGAPAHFYRLVSHYLIWQYLQGQIGRWSSIVWPAMSSNLTRMGFFLKSSIQPDANRIIKTENGGQYSEIFAAYLLNVVLQHY